MNHTVPFVTLVVACRNEERYIKRCLDSLVAQDYPKDRMEIFVVDGMSGDRTSVVAAEYALAHPHITILQNSRLITPCAFNIGIRKAKGDYVFFMGAHAMYQSNYVSLCVRNAESSGADNVGGMLNTMSSVDSPQAKAIALTLSHPFGAGNARFRVGSAKPEWVDTVFGGCYRRDVFERVGLFNEHLVRSQDMEFNTRLKNAGGKILLVPDIVTTYYPKATLGEFFTHNVSDGIWAIYPLRFVKTSFSLRHYIPLAFVSYLVGSALLGIFFKPFFVLFLAGLFFYLAVSFVVSYAIAKKERDIRLLFLMPAAFACRHVGCGLGSLYGVIILFVPLFRKIAKRTLDIICSFFGLVVLSPFFLVVALLIKRYSPGPVFYRGVRVGKDDRLFRIYKFRTMVQNADKMGGPSTAGDDPRLTGIGKFLRAYKLDEFPQLINVLKGEMSLVGPRPEVPLYVNMMTNEEKRIILSIRPGITDLASLWNIDEAAVLHGSPDPEKTYQEKIWPEKKRLQIKYVKEQSFFGDLVVIFRTLINIFR